MRNASFSESVRRKPINTSDISVFAGSMVLLLPKRENKPLHVQALQI